LSESFWSRKLSGSTPPPHAQPARAAGLPPGMAWWQAPAQGYTPPQGQVPPDSGESMQYTYQQLKSMRADQMDQDMMEQLALMELQEKKYNNACPQCGSNNFLPAGARVGTQRMGTDKCFECGASSSALTSSPEPAIGGGGKAGRATKQLNGGQGNYGTHHSQLPKGFIPTR